MFAICACPCVHGSVFLHGVRVYVELSSGLVDAERSVLQKSGVLGSWETGVLGRLPLAHEKRVNFGEFRPFLLHCVHSTAGGLKSDSDCSRQRKCPRP